MSIKNARITEIVEAVTKNINQKIYLINQNNDINDFMTALLRPNNLDGSLTLQQLNENWKTSLTKLYRNQGQINPVIANLVFLDKKEQLNSQQILEIIIIQLQAISHGAKFSQKDYSRREINVNPTTKVKNIHYHQGYHHHCHEHFLAYPWLPRPQPIILNYNANNRINNNRNHHGHASANQNESNKNQGAGATGILLAIAALGATLATIVYAVIEILRRFDEIFHKEDVLGNIAKLAVTAYAAYTGSALGAYLALSFCLNPVFGSVCGAIILAAIGMKLAKLTVATAHHITNTTSAIAEDPRFCLKASEKTNLQNKGYDPQAVSEAIREIGIWFKHNKANGLLFWKKNNIEQYKQITLLRKLKTGSLHSQYVEVNGKAFDLLMKPNNHINSSTDRPAAGYPHVYPPAHNERQYHSHNETIETEMQPQNAPSQNAPSQYEDSRINNNLYPTIY